MRQVKSLLILATLGSAAPLALASGLKATNGSERSWSLERIKDSESLFSDTPQPELAVTWERRSASVEEKQAANPGDVVAVDFGKCQVGDTVFLQVRDSQRPVPKANLSVKLTRVRDFPFSEPSTAVTFHPAFGESDAVKTVAKWEGDSLTLFGNFWVSEWL